MKEKEITRLLEKFFDGTTTLSEERRLYSYFAGGDVAEGLEQYRPLLAGLSALAEPRRKPARRNFVRLAIGTAASLLLLAGGYTAWNAYENHMLEMNYDGSYMIVNGRRIDNLSEIKSHIKSTLSQARDIEQMAAAQPSVSDIEQELILNISDPEELARIKELLELV